MITNKELFPSDSEKQPLSLIEGRVVFGFYDCGALLCDDEISAQDLIESCNIPVSPQELSTYHNILRNAGVEHKYAFTIINNKQQRLTVYIDKKAHDTIYYGWPSYRFLARFHLIKYIRVYAREVLTGIWVAEKPAKIRLRIGHSDLHHVNAPRTWPLK